MSTTIHTIPLLGCTPEPLMNYLKALGVLRLVSEQADPSARGFWQGDTFCLQTTLDEDALCQFFLERYEPTPIVVPWSGADYFDASRSPKRNDFDHAFSGQKRPAGSAIIEAFLVTASSRLDKYRHAITAVFDAMSSIKLTKKSQIEGASGARTKATFLTQLRGAVADDVVPWIDASVVLSDDAISGFNRMLGSGGGSDGNSHFSDNFMQAVWLVLRDFDSQRRTPSPSLSGMFDTSAAIRNSLFATDAPGVLIRKLSPGLFNSQRVGGPNSSSRDSSDAASNPWDFVLMLEGALSFAGAVSKKLGTATPVTASFPFSVRMTPVGSGSLLSSEASNREVWLPLWRHTADYRELQQMFSESRVSLRGRLAEDGLDIARALNAVGVDRGISAFQRIGVVKGRVGGDNYHTTISLGRWEVSAAPGHELILEIDQWLTSFRRAAQSDGAPASAGRALRRLEKSILDLCRQRSAVRLQDVLIALGECEQVLATSSKWRNGDGKRRSLRPVPLLTHKWLQEAGKGIGSSTEFRLAISLAGLFAKGIGSLRQQIEPVTIGKDRGSGQQQAFFVDESSAAASVVWSNADLERNLAVVVKRRIVEALRLGATKEDDVLVFPDRSACAASLGDVTTFLNHATDDRRIAELVRGLMLLNWADTDAKQAAQQLGRGDQEPVPDATFGMLKLCHTHQKVPYGSFECQVRLDPRIARLLAAGRVADAIKLAAQRLRGCGLPSAFKLAGRDKALGQRLLAALLFPLTQYGIRGLARRSLDRSRQSLDDDADTLRSASPQAVIQD